MLTLSKFSTFNIGTKFGPSVPNRGNNFVSTLSFNGSQNIAIGGGKYFVLDNSAKTVQYGTAWASLTSVAVNYRPLALAYNSPTNSEYLLAGDDSSTNFPAKFWSSTTGTSWTLASITAQNYSQITANCAIWDGVQFLAAGGSSIASGTLFKGTTVNGIVLYATLSGIGFISVASNQSRAVVVGSDYASLYYTNTSYSSFTKVTNPASIPYVSQVTYGNGVFIASGQGCVYVSSDGITWSTVTSTLGTDYLSAIVFYSNVFYAIGAGTNLYMSIDGINWTKKTTSIPSGGFIVNLCVDANLISLQWASGGTYTLYTSA